jgi:hypothetical protein
MRAFLYLGCKFDISLMPARLVIPGLYLRSYHFLQGDMNHAVPGDPIFGIEQTAEELKKCVPSIPNIWVTVKGGEIDKHIAFQKKP